LWRPTSALEAQAALNRSSVGETVTSSQLGTDLATLECALLMGGITVFLILVVFKQHYGITARLINAITWPVRALWKSCNRLLLWLIAIAIVLGLILLLGQEITGVPLFDGTIDNMSGK
jgi:hypothetical protein